MEYEYKLLSMPSAVATEEQLNALGKEGWLLQAVYPSESKTIYAFARVKKPH